MRRTLPLVRFDPGWLYVVSGLTMIAAAVLIPPQKQLDAMRRQVDTLRSVEAVEMERLAAYAEFRTRLARRDEALFERIAAAQLNLIHPGERVLLTAGTAESTITDWIDASVEPVTIPTVVEEPSRLERLATGPHRHWLIAGAALCVFVGLLMGNGGRGAGGAD